jgi:subtilisin-like proprotein convertase family protein
MKKKNYKYFIFILSCFFLIFTVSAQNSDELWSKSRDSEGNFSKKIDRRTIPKKFEVFHLNLNLLKKKLKNIAAKNVNIEKPGIVLSFPNAHGTLERYTIFEASVMEESLQKKYPTIRSYLGKGIDNPKKTIRFSVTPLGLHAMAFNNLKGSEYIDVYTENKESYIVYAKKNLPNLNDPFECKFDEINKVAKVSSPIESAKTQNANDGLLRTFRLAVATTGEYSQYHLSRQGISDQATDEEKKTAVLSAIAATMTIVNAIFERDVAITMKLVEENDQIIFLDPDTDNLTNDDGSVLINESQTVIDADIGTDNYDIGHTFSTQGGGLAQLNSPCVTGNKARGVTGVNNPIGDSYAIDYVVHEMGHQFGAHHSFNSEAGSCGDGNRNDPTAVEPGSGSTIMAYAGLCAPENVQSNSDSYFHLVSIREMWANIKLGNSNCAQLTPTENNPPILEDLPNYSIPISTPFVLNAAGSDIDGDDLTYTWEQLDTEITSVPLVSTATGGPAFRSVAPGNSSKRYFPDINTVIAGNLSTAWEVIPSVERTMKFGVNVRDNKIIVIDGEGIGAGQTASEETTIDFVASSGPFQVTSQASAETWDAGTAQTVTWDVANTNVAPINCSFVNILMSVDGGLTYPIILASNVENVGSYEIVAPNNSTSSGRIKVASSGNIFYALNAADITIQASEFIMNFDTNNQSVCVPDNAIYTLTYNTFLGFDEETTFSASGGPTGSIITFNPTTAISDNTIVEMTISNMDTDDIEHYNITVTGTSASTTKNTTVNLEVYSAVVNPPDLTFPAKDATDVLKPYSLNWDKDVNAQSYDVQIATDIGFGTVLEEATANINFYVPQLLQFNTTYFWRVKSINDCGESSFSTVFNFTTADEVCDTDIATDTPLNIPENFAGVESIITITENKLISDVNVTVNITHTYVEDLSLSLIGPNGKSVILATGIGEGGNNFTNTVFDDEASVEINTGAAPFTGIFRPVGDLSVFNDEESYGEWKLRVVDSQEEDLGSIQNWQIDICGILVISDDDDKDGVVNSIDLCPNTPLGTLVDAFGCTIFILPSDNFTVKSISETCPDKNNGQIEITANEAHDYYTIINETKYNFTNTLTLDNLTPELYSFCIFVTGEHYEQCYTVEIGDGIIVEGKASISGNNASIEITQGTAPFEVFVNDKKVLETTSPIFSIPVNHGDFLEVKTDVDCEGVFSKSIEIFDAVIAYPNPTNGIVEIALPVSQEEVTIVVYNTLSQLISRKTYNVVSGKVHLSLENEPAGLFIAKLLLEKPVFLKILKQ